MHGGLGGLRLLLTVHVGHERDVDECKVVVADAELELTHGFDEGGGFDVTNCAAELGGGEIGR